MQEMTLDTLLAVFEEMFGFWLFWGMVVAAVLVTAGLVYVLVRDRHVESRRLVLAELAAPVGAVLAVLFVFWITNSRLSHMGGPVDWIVLLGIAVAGGVGLVVLAYVVQSMVAGRRRRRETGGVSQPRVSSPAR